MSYKALKNTKTTIQKGGNTAKILGFTLNSTPFNEVLNNVVSRLRAGVKTFIVTPNPEFLIYGRKHPWFKQSLNASHLAIPDGIGLAWASRILGTRPAIKERVSGIDLMGALCHKAASQGWSVYLLGGEIGVAETAAGELKKKYPGLKISADNGPRLKLDDKTGLIWPKTEVVKVVNTINKKSPDLLFVAFGMGKQEKFIADNWAKLNVRLAMGIGGAFDYISGKIPRAPLCVRKIGFEWFYRLLKQPWRIKRQLNLLKFVTLILKDKLSF